MAKRASAEIGLDKDRREPTAMLRRMIEIRHFENLVQALFTKGLVRGSTHLCNGQEATVVGAAAALEPGDTMTCTYRGHGAVLAMGSPADRCFGEILGRSEGLCGGKGGSMHLTDVAVGAMGAHAIVGAHLPIATGLALAEKMNGTGQTTICFFGDGATNIGAFHEALNLASIWRLPVIFFCENNLYGEYSPVASTTPVTELAKRADAYAMPGERVDGNDPVAVMSCVDEAVKRARAGDGPTLIEGLTYRQVGHSRSDPAKYRPEGELEHWLGRDPIELLKRTLIAEGAAEAELGEVENEAKAGIDQALERALEWPPPEQSALMEDVWA